MRLTLDLLILSVVLFAFLEFAVPQSAKLQLSDRIFLLWYRLHRYSHRRVVISTLNAFRHKVDQIFGSPSRTLLLCAKFNFCLFSFFILAFFIGLAYGVFYALDYTHWTLQHRLHIQNYIIAAYNGEDYPGYWLSNTQDITTTQYRRLVFAANSSTMIYTYLICMAISTILSFTSLEITRLLIKRVRKTRVHFLLATDFMLAVFFAITSAGAIFFFRAGWFISSETYRTITSSYLDLFDLKYQSVQGIFQLSSDSIWRMQEIADQYSYLAGLDIVLGEILASYLSILYTFDFGSVGAVQTLLNWSFLLNMLPTLTHLSLISVCIFLSYTYAPTKQWLIPMIEWMHSHPKGPIAVVLACLTLILGILRVLIS